MTQAITVPLSLSDTSQLATALSGTSLLSKKVAVIMLILYSSAWKSVEAPLDQLCIIAGIVTV